MIWRVSREEKGNYLKAGCGFAVREESSLESQ